MKTKTVSHVVRISKCRPRVATAPGCDDHSTQKKRDKCHKGKIPPVER